LEKKVVVVVVAAAAAAVVVRRGPFSRHFKFQKDLLPF